MNVDEALGRVKDVPGDMAEFGVYEGNHTIRMADRYPERWVWAWDTFSGMPDDGYVEALDSSDPPGKWKPQRDVLKVFGEMKLLKIVPVVGKFSDTIPAFPFLERAVGRDVKFSFVHVDCDHYSGHKMVLNFIAPRMAAGGIVLFDDPGLPGAKKAIDEWLESTKVKCDSCGHETGRKLEENKWVQF
jgi:O-methyltransferase